MHTSAPLRQFLDASPSPSVPSFRPPPGACDSHCHVFGPYDRFPLAPEKTYLPPEATPATYLRMLDTLGCDRGVLVQASAHGLDNGALLDALEAGGSRLRGVAVAEADTTPATLHDLYERGIRGLRVSRLPMPDGRPRYKNAVDVSALDTLLPAMRDIGLHAQLWVGLDQLAELEPMIRSAGIPFVIDHIGRCDPTRGTRDPAFQRLCGLVADGLLWVKLTPYRSSLRYPGFEDMRPFHEALVAANPDCLLWGSDWPHINLSEDIPDAGKLLDLLAQWTPDADILSRILVHNPARLYGF